MFSRMVISCLLGIAVLVAGEGRAWSQTPLYKDAKAPVAKRVGDLLSRMTLDEKIGQMTQVERSFLQDEAHIATYGLGSLLSGGGSAPNPNTPTAWADMYDRYQHQAVATRLGIPLLYGVDAVHGSNNVFGATIFPHNIGLGATHNPALVEEIGHVTALEMLGTGIDWTFAPCLAVARDERWGRFYESFGEDPELVKTMARQVTGLQGTSLSAATSVMATAKHWIADGGSANGSDRGDAQIPEAQLRAIHLVPFKEAIARNVGAVMVSFGSWNGQKMHGDAYLLTTVLKGELKFKGFVVSDWGGIDGLASDYPGSVRMAINGGIDMVMVPQNYMGFIVSLRDEVNAGRVPMTRIDDAVSRILTKKFELGLFERPYANRAYTSLIGAPAHRAVARNAVRQSLVLLKNAGNLLPLPRTAKLFVAGKSADNMGLQCGGWTISWQGGSGDITPGTTILQGIREAIATSGGTTSGSTKDGNATSGSVTYDRDANGIDATYSAAIVVVGEMPYAEGNGDKPALPALDNDDMAVLNKIKAAGVPTIVVLVSGRPMDIAAQLPDWNALVAAWLPGSEGEGVADVLFGASKFSGKLSQSWPRSSAQLPINRGDAIYDPLFPYGAGLTYAATPKSTPKSTLAPKPAPRR